MDDRHLTIIYLAYRHLDNDAFFAVMLSVIMLNVVMLSVIMLSVIMLSVVAPRIHLEAPISHFPIVVRPSSAVEP